MSVKLDFANANATIEVIDFSDSAVSCDQEAYTEYLKSLDETILQLKEGEVPSRFVMRKDLIYGAKMAVKSHQVKLIAGKPEFQFGSILEEVRLSLVDVKVPGYKMPKETDGTASKALIANLDAAGIVQNLYVALNMARTGATDPEELKKS